MQKNNQKEQPNLNEIKESVPKKFEKRTKKNRISRFLFKMVAANVINVILIVATFYLIGRMPTIAERIKELRSAQIALQEQSGAAVLQSDIDRNQSKIDSLQNLFLDDEGFIVFIRELNNLQSEGLVAEFDLTGGRTVVNKDGTSTLPVTILFQGQQDQINSALQRITSLPIILVPGSVELQVLPQTEENSGGYAMSYSAFLVVDGNFAEN